jgi:glycogen operon protein
VKLIAEPWDCGPGGYQVGAFPPGWSEWNDKYRDEIRDFWRGEAPAAALAPRLTASGELFNHGGRRPSASVNFITAHDGFTLNDLVSYNEKHNEANGEENRDGHSHNRSWNCGAEGPTDNPEINALRERQMRNFLATLLLSQGTPMLLAGDEFARTQKGNNNAYCQDNDLSWLHWDIDERGRKLTRFVQKLTKLRHEYPVLRKSHFLNGQFDERIGAKDLIWVNATGEEMTPENWQDGNTRSFAMLIDGRALGRMPHEQREHSQSALIVFNAHHDVVQFTLPKSPAGKQWTRLIDTNLEEHESNVSLDAGHQYSVTGRSLLLFCS